MQDWNSFNGAGPLKSQTRCDCNSYQGEEGREGEGLAGEGVECVAHKAHDSQC